MKTGAVALVEPIYAPVLAVKRSSTAAYAEVDMRLRRRIAPIWTVVPRVGPERTRGVCLAPDPDTDQFELNHWLSGRMDSLIGVTEGTQGWLDAGHVESNVVASAPSLWRLATTSGLRLVTGPEREPTYQRHIADLAFLTGRGLGIRVLLDDAPQEQNSAQLLDLIARLCLPPSRLDLLLDLGMVIDGESVGKTALAALDLLAGLAPWRTVVLISGAVPRDPEGRETPVFQVAPRRDWQLYRSVGDARPEYPRRVVYGDYSVEHALRANLPSVRKPGPPWGLLRYTTPDGFLLTRVPTRGANRADQVRAMAGRTVRHGSFRDREFSAGEHRLHACATGAGRVGSGSAETWIKVGHIQHMALVAECLGGAPFPT